jgi:aminopeptidase N
MKKSVLLLLIIVGSVAQAQSFPSPEVRIIREKQPYHTMGVLEAQSVSSPDYDVYFYKCEWEIDPAVRYIKGVVRPHFTITAATASITLDLSNALTVDSVIYHGSKTTFQQSATDALRIQFPAGLPVGQKDSVSIYYKGIPPNNGSGAFTQTTHNNVPVLWTLSEPYGARTWWPCKDALTDKADSIDIVLTYPAAYRSSSNGLPVQELHIGDKKQDHWKHRYPIATYLVAFAVTNYQVDYNEVQLPSRKMPVVMYAYPEDALAFQQATNAAKAGLIKFSELLGEYPFSRERYAQTQFGRGGGMEHQTNSFIASPQAWLVAHELAHQWFGDKVTNGSWQDLWLNEGFATYMELVYDEMVVNNTLPVHLLKDWRDRITDAPGGAVFIADTTTISRLFDYRLTYLKGGYVLHMLRWKLGDSAFFQGMRNYLNDPALRYKTARTADLQRHMEEVSGQNLAGFFSDWIYGEGYPDYRALWSSAGTTTVQLALSQTTSHSSVPFYSMPVPLQFKSAGRDTILTVNHTRNNEMFTLDLSFVPDTLIIDPQLWILAKNKSTQKKDRLSEPRDVTVYPNPAINKVSVYLPATTAQNTSVRLFNTLGQQVYSKTVLSGGNEGLDIPLHHLASGMYWIQLTGSAGLRMTKQLLIIK